MRTLSAKIDGVKRIILCFADAALCFLAFIVCKSLTSISTSDSFPTRFQTFNKIYILGKIET